MNDLVLEAYILAIVQGLAAGIATVLILRMYMEIVWKPRTMILYFLGALAIFMLAQEVISPLQAPPLLAAITSTITYYTMADYAPEPKRKAAA